MPKKKKACKNTKNKNINVEKRSLVEADLGTQIYGVIDKALGSRFFDVSCLDNKTRRCKVRKKRMKVKTSDVVIVSLRDFDDNNADIIYRYDSDEVRQLQKMGVLPSSEFLGNRPEFGSDNDNDEEMPFDFGEI